MIEFIYVLNVEIKNDCRCHFNTKYWNIKCLYSWSGSILTTDHRNESAHHQRSYSLSPSDMNRSASSRGLWIRGSGNKDKKGRSKSSFFWRSTSESSGRSSKSVIKPQILIFDCISTKMTFFWKTRILWYMIRFRCSFQAKIQETFLPKYQVKKPVIYLRYHTRYLRVILLRQRPLHQWNIVPPQL